MGEVLPVAEDCSTPADDDCNGKMNDHCALWAMRIGGQGDQSPYDLAVAPSGQSIFVGSTSGDIYVAENTLKHSGGYDALVVKLDAAGVPLWGRVYGDALEQSANNVEIDLAGNIYITGEFQGTMSFGAAPELNLTSAGDMDIFIAKLDGNGNPLWARRFGDQNAQSALALAVGKNDELYVGGRFSGTVVFGPETKSAIDANGFVLKLDAKDGTPRWARTFGAEGNDSVSSLSIDKTGNVVVGGSFTNTAIFGSILLTSPDSNGAGVIGKYTSDGSPIWFSSYGLGKDGSLGISGVMGSDQIVASGLFSADVDFGCGKIPHVSTTDLFVLKVDALGKCLWSKGFGSPGEAQTPWAVSTDAQGNVLVTEAFTGSIDFGGGVVSEPKVHDILVLKFDPSGKLLWSRNFGDPEDQDGRGIGADSAGNVYILGEFRGSVNFGSINFSTVNGDDACVFKLPP